MPSVSSRAICQFGHIQLLLLFALISLAAAQRGFPSQYETTLKMSGVYKRAGCACTTDASPGQRCDANWAQEYEVEASGSSFSAIPLTVRSPMHLRKWGEIWWFEA